MRSQPTFFQRIILPGFAFKAVVIGGGYATGRELVQFFLPSGPRGGLFGLALTACLWSAISATTFLFAYETHSRNYKDFFRALLGRFWILFEIAYVILVILILSVFGAAAGAISAKLIGVPPIAGTIALAASIASFATFGNNSVEQLFKYVSIGLYAVYIILVTLVYLRFGAHIRDTLAASSAGDRWVIGAVTYSAYNVLGATVILPVTRHFRGRSDALWAGALCGPLAAIPAVMFFLAIVAFYPNIGRETLPSDFILRRLGFPVFRYVYQLMILAALLESGTGIVHAINERAAGLFGKDRSMPALARLGITTIVLIFSIFVASEIGLVQLIAKGYTWSAYVFIVIFIIPLAVVGLPQIFSNWAARRRG